MGSYKKAKKYIRKNKKTCYVLGKRKKKLIDLAQEELGIIFSPQHRDFLRSYGAISFGATEICGLVNENFNKPSASDVVWNTLEERKNGLPSKLCLVYRFGNGDLFCLDYNSLNTDGEPRVVSYRHDSEKEDQEYEVIAEDFGDFLWGQMECEGNGPF